MDSITVGPFLLFAVIRGLIIWVIQRDRSDACLIQRSLLRLWIDKQAFSPLVGHWAKNHWIHLPHATLSTVLLVRSPTPQQLLLIFVLISLLFKIGTVLCCPTSSALQCSVVQAASVEDWEHPTDEEQGQHELWDANHDNTESLCLACIFAWGEARGDNSANASGQWEAIKEHAYDGCSHA